MSPVLNGIRATGQQPPSPPTPGSTGCVPWSFRVKPTWVGSPVLLQAAGWVAWDNLIHV